MPSLNSDISLKDFHAVAWQRWEQAMSDRSSAARLLTLASVDETGAPQIRSVVIRGVNAAQAQLEVHTDRTTPKVTELLSAPIAALHVWLPDDQLQIRARADVTVKAGLGLEEKWAKVPAKARVAYGVQPASGTRLPGPLAYTIEPSLDRFALLQCDIQELDLLYLGTQHIRAQFRRSDGWHGCWVAP